MRWTFLTVRLVATGIRERNGGGWGGKGRVSFVSGRWGAAITS